MQASSNDWYVLIFFIEKVFSAAQTYTLLPHWTFTASWLVCRTMKQELQKGGQLRTLVIAPGLLSLSLSPALFQLHGHIIPNIVHLTDAGELTHFSWVMSNWSKHVGSNMKGFKFQCKRGRNNYNVVSSLLS